jgi:predicted enzyme related to lactoylglutathione lyase
MKSFYTSLFDWELTDGQDPSMPTHIDAGEGPGGGIMPADPNGFSHWMPYVQVDDIKAYTKKANDLGANIVSPPTKIPTGGSFSVIQDPSGAVIGLYQP